MSPENIKSSPWSPFRIKLYRNLWIAMVVSNVGTWMHDLGAGWLMTSLSDSPIMVAMVQTASTLPMFMLAIPAGVLADILDRRRYILTALMWMMGFAMILGLLSLAGMVQAWSLIALTFALGMGTAMLMPAMAAIVPELVPKDELQKAISINAMGVNVSRAIGPATAGIIISIAGSGVVFIINAFSFLLVLIVFWRWKRRVSESELPAERFITALVTGFRFFRHSPALQATLIRSFGFFFFSCSLWALLPLVAKDLVGGGPQTFGVLMASIGIGAILGSLFLPRIRENLSSDSVLGISALVYISTLLMVANFHNAYITALSIAVFGASWIAGVSTVQVAAQMSLPNWVRSRGLSIAISVFMGSMALGSLFWGAIARETDIASSLTYAAMGGFIALLVTWRWHISGIEQSDLTPSMHWDMPVTHDDVTHDRTPVMIMVEYQVVHEKIDLFLELIHKLGRNRKRDGAFSWYVLESARQPDTFVETYMIESWLEHMRQHERVTNEDRIMQIEIRKLLVEDSRPVVKHYIGPLK